MQVMYTCPVCGYDQLDEPPTRHKICPQCGTQFDFDDVGVSHAELRQRWIDGGRRFWRHEAQQSLEAQADNEGV